MQYRKNIFTFISILALSSFSAHANETPQVAVQKKPAPKVNSTVTEIVSVSPESKKKIAPELAKEIEEIKGDPSALLDKFPKGGPKMAKYVAQIAAADFSVVDSVLDASRIATADQASAIGAGLARAVRGFSAGDAKSVSEKVAKAGALPTQISYNAIGGSTKIAAYDMPDPVRIGLSDTTLRLDSGFADKSTVMGSNLIYRPAGDAFPLLPEDNIVDFMGRPETTASVLANEPEDSGAFSTSPTE